MKSPIDPLTAPAWVAFLADLEHSLSTEVSSDSHSRNVGLRWFEHSMFFHDVSHASIALPLQFVATHNHFVLDRGGKVFNRQAPIIKLPADANRDDHLALLGLLNSSTACFWMKQVILPKGGGGIGTVRIQDEPWETNRYEYAGTEVRRFQCSKAAALVKWLEETTAAIIR